MGTTYQDTKPIPEDEITPKHLYQTRRKFIKNMGTFTAAGLLAACAPPSGLNDPPMGTIDPLATPTDIPALRPTRTPTSYQDNLTDYEAATNYINYYEFSLGKESVSELAKDFTTSPWDVEISGLVKYPTSLSINELRNTYKQEMRTYRMRCVEGWSMVLPWTGFPLWKLLEDVEPLPDAKYVSFETVFRPEEMPMQRSFTLPWPYLEGLRLDEAMHDLTLLATGMYGEKLLPQNGAPIRLVVPWKYGFKSIKSIVKIKLVADQPVTMWNAITPQEYGFYANVNPEVDHPRWSQATERRIGELNRRPTLLHNGYADQVAYLYEGMNLSKFN